MLDDACVIYWTLLDSRHHPTGCTRHYADGKLQSGFAGLAVAAYEGDSSFYLFYCDDRWQVQNDTLYGSLAEAKTDAERQFAGTAATWIEKRPASMPDG